MSGSGSVADTPWERGRFDARVAPRRLLFGHMYNPAIQDRAFTPGARVFCIASAGDTALALAERHPVVAVDINPVQLAYARSRLGGGGTNRHRRAVAVRGSVAPPTCRVASGDRGGVLALDSTETQLAFWHAHLDTRRFRAGVDLLLSLTGLRQIYASPFLRVLPPRFGAVMRAPHGALLLAPSQRRRTPTPGPCCWGEYHVGSTASPPVEWVCADAAGYLEPYPRLASTASPCPTCSMAYLSGYRARLLAALRRAGTPVFRVVLRSFAEPSGPLTANVAAEDRSMLWGLVEVVVAARF